MKGHRRTFPLFLIASSANTKSHANIKETCTIAIVMLGDLPTYIPGGRASFHKTDIASFSELFDAAAFVSARCLGDDRLVGWFQSGKIWSILINVLHLGRLGTLR